MDTATPGGLSLSLKVSQSVPAYNRWDGMDGMAWHWTGDGGVAGWRGGMEAMRGRVWVDSVATCYLLAGNWLAGYSLVGRLLIGNGWHVNQEYKICGASPRWRGS